MSRATSIGPHDIYLLDQWGRQLTEAFGAGAMLVGSVARGEKDWRDVDIRMPLPKSMTRMSDHAIRAVNLAVTLWGRQVTALPIDFQMQRADEFKSYDNDIRNPMGPRSKTGWALYSVPSTTSEEKRG